MIYSYCNLSFVLFLFKFNYIICIHGSFLNWYNINIILYFGVIVMKIYLTRHGETIWNTEGKMQGWKNSNLTSKGIRNAEKLGEHLSNIDFDYIYCSPLGRAKETAEHILKDRNLNVIYDNNLKEMNFGIWEGVSNSEVDLLYAEQKFNFWNQPHLYETIEGESFELLLLRVSQWFEKMKKAHINDTILVVTHTCVIKSLYSILKNLPLEEFWAPPFIYDTSLTILEVTETSFKFIVESDISHLSEL